MQVNVYIDISILGQILIYLNSYLFALKINHLKISKICVLLITFFSTLMSFVLYFLGINKSYFFLFLISFILNKKSKTMVSISYVLFIILNCFLASILKSEFIVTYGLILAIKIESFFSYLSILFFTFLVFLVLIKTISFLKIKRFVYKLNVKLNDKILPIKGYYDTGNTLLFKGLPVVFLKSKKVLKIGGFSSFDINQNRMYKKGKIYLKLNKRRIEKEVMICLVSEKENFFGCDCLLNSNLF